MPQIKTEKKFFQIRIEKNFQEFTEIIVVKGFQGFKKNITGGAK